MFGKSTPEPRNTDSYRTPTPVPEPSVAPVAPPPQEIRVDTIIGEGTRIVGTVTCKTLLRVDGIIEGTVSAEGKAVISEKGLVKGDIHAENLTVGGELTGNAYIRGKAEILATGRLNGDIVTRTLIMDENAILEGKCSMSQSSVEKLTDLSEQSFQQPVKERAVKKAVPSEPAADNAEEELES